MRVAFLTNSIGFAGAEKVMAFVANSLSERGHSVYIVNFNSGGSYINGYTQSFRKSITVYTYDGKETGNKRHVELIRFVLDTSRRIKPDVFVGFTTFPNYVGKIVGTILRVPSIMSERGDPHVTINKQNLHSLLELCVINRSEGAVFQIQGAAEFFAKGLQRRGIIIPNPIFVNEKIEVVSATHREKSIVSVGRLDNFQKRYDIMIKAFALFSRTHSEYILKLYGEGMDKENIQKWADESGVSSKVKLMGLSKRPMRDICQDGIFLITSDFEGISNSLLEAMAIGLPCVSTNSSPGGARMLISNEENGLLCPVGDVASVAEALSRFADNPQLADICGQKAKSVVKRFNPTLLMDEWENYLKRIVYEYNQTS